MAARNIFRVMPNGKSWEVRKDRALLNRFRLKERAVAKARELARNIISSRVIVYRPDGSLIKNN